MDKRFVNLEFQVRGPEEMDRLKRILSDPRYQVVVVASLPVLQAFATLDNVERAEVLRKVFGTALGITVDAACQLAAPDTGPDSAVRDENGRIVGVRRLIRSVEYDFARSVGMSRKRRLVSAPGL
ncbi:hypothetical protein K3767_07570 [Thermosulfurimonas sp. F29]|nr:hypothetical protein [Thermosulfurimonas sp. F29]